MIIKDDEIREKLSKILGSYKPIKQNFGYGSNFEEVKVLSWIEIAFEIGKLKK